MRILVFGANGQVGRCLMQCRSEGLDIVGTTRAEVDLASPDQIGPALARYRPDVVINATAYTAVDKAESERDLAFAVNRDAVAHMAQHCARLRLPLLHISTDYVFDGSGDRPYVETDATGPLSVYGASKLDGERALSHSHEAHVILRTSWVYAVQGNNFIRTMQRLGRDRDEVLVVADQRGAPTAAEDIARVLVAIAQRTHAATERDRPALYGTYHYTGAGETTWHGLAEAVFEDMQQRTGRRPRCTPITTAAYPTPAKRPANSRLDCTKFDQVFGLPRPDWRESVARMLAAPVA